MKDRELLELAAKAAGYDVVWNEQWSCFQHRNPQPDKHGTMRHPWVPLDDDGDALRLAVKLELITGHDADDKLAYAQVRHPHFSANEFYGGADLDSCAATRRAIVRAAAEIGKEMP
jgi:hypothetical protein